MSILNSLKFALIGVCLAATAAFAGPVNINKASEAELAESLTGIGSARAAAIVEYRKKNGPFRNANDLTKIEGIGSHIVELNRKLILVADAPQKK
ncbi:MAG: helix-hairpin-helix domain-containing protein [Pseudomonadota bacterium]